MRITKEKINLECKLTDVERLQYSKEISEAIKNRGAAEDSLKAVGQQKKAEIAEQEEKINRLAGYINSGFEYRFIDCVIEYDFKAKERRWIRQDTKEIAKTDIIPEADLQEEMRLKNPKKKKAAAEKGPEKKAPADKKKKNITKAINKTAESFSDPKKQEAFDNETANA
jgi:hypothetical protein